MGVIFYSVIVLAVLGVVIGIALGISVEAFKVEVPEKLKKIEETLPGLNCGACGYPGCSGYAKAIFEGKAPLNRCTPGGQALADNLKKILEENK